jgi:superoxide dismutase, Fe-Mn family
MRIMTRREAFRTAAGAAAGLVVASTSSVSSVLRAQAPAAPPPAPPTGPFTLPALGYAFDALDPHIDARTMEIHHNRHHQAYVNNLNLAVQGNAALSAMTIDQLMRGINDVPMALRARIQNNGGGHYNHSMFWTIMAPNAGGAPTGNLAAAINSSFTNFDTFKSQFKTACMARFGSGWGWVVKNPQGRLEIVTSANQDSPLMTGQLPILGLDVWEHAYYLHYQNRRNDYIDAWWNVVNWPTVAQRFAAA